MFYIFAVEKLEIALKKLRYFLVEQALPLVGQVYEDIKAKEENFKYLKCKINFTIVNNIVYLELCGDFIQHNFKESKWNETWISVLDEKTFQDTDPKLCADVLHNLVFYGCETVVFSGTLSNAILWRSFRKVGEDGLWLFEESK